MTVVMNKAPNALNMIFDSLRERSAPESGSRSKRSTSWLNHSSGSAWFLSRQLKLKEIIMQKLEYPNRTGLPSRQFRAAIHDLDIAGIAEEAVALPGGQLLDDAKLLQVDKRLVDRGRGDASLFHQRA